MEKIPQWLQWAREIQSLSQTGLTFSQSEYEKERFVRLAEIAAHIVQRYSDVEKETALENFLIQPGYATPKIDVRAAVIRDNKILLVQESSDRRWSMPGGWADVGDLPSGAVERETFEESGFEVKAKKLIGVFDANRSGRPMEFFHAFKLIFLCTVTGGSAQPSTETLAVDFFDFHLLPPLSENRTNERHIEEIILHLEDEQRPALFD
jgi:ADP-ribose pyrophosphatase YjhB (NUDIX family)